MPKSDGGQESPRHEKTGGFFSEAAGFFFSPLPLGGGRPLAGRWGGKSDAAGRVPTLLKTTNSTHR